MLNHHRDIAPVVGAGQSFEAAIASFETRTVVERATSKPRDEDEEYAVAVNYILDDCFFAIGQGVQDRKTISHAAVIWWRDQYRQKALGTMVRYGNRWLQDRSRVTSTCRMIGARAVHHAGDAPEIDLDAAKKATADVQEFCIKHAKRRSRRLGQPEDTDQHEMFAGYWCTL